MSVASEFRRRFCANALFLGSCTVAEERVRKSGELAAGLGLILKNGKSLTKSEHDGLSDLVIASSTWTAADSTLLIRALDDSLRKKRRSEQRWADGLLGIFTEDEWTPWKANGLNGIDSTLDEMILRVKLLGAKNLCEFTKKKLTAIWLHLRGDGAQLDSGGRSRAKELLKTRVSKHLKKQIPPSTSKR
jgi:hypothetical protein